MLEIKQMRVVFPLILFAFIVIILWRGLSLHPAKVPSPLINKPAPVFELPLLNYPDRVTTNKDFIGRITLLNVWASWCHACAAEHEFLVELGKKEYLSLYGLNYKDDPINASAWLHQLGNPYKIVALDRAGKVSIDWGVYGTPETFLIDKKGIIRYKQIGPMTPESWKQNFEPLVEKIRKEAA